MQSLNAPVNVPQHDVNHERVDMSLNPLAIKLIEGQLDHDDTYVERPHY